MTLYVENDRQPLAHTAATDSVFRDHDLADHLREVARLVGAHATSFDGRDWARLAGLWHDLGKYGPQFPSYIRVAFGTDAE
jgi:CRISPR-associated endonuclease/helicase Cas3